ncbi:MAG: hypothetical protein PHV06_09595 [bacterium]|nr:hypothetical protein [bacterium]
MNDIKEDQTPMKKRFNWERFCLCVISILIIVFFLMIAIPNIIHQHQYPHPRMSCHRQLINIGIIINQYHVDNKHYPQNLEVLIDKKYLDELPRCWVEDKPYIYQIEGWDSKDFTVWCPNPEKHAGTKGPKSVTASLYYHSGEGIIQVDK